MLKIAALLALAIVVKAHRPHDDVKCLAVTSDGETMFSIVCISLPDVLHPGLESLAMLWKEFRAVDQCFANIFFSGSLLPLAIDQRGKKLDAEISGLDNNRQFRPLVHIPRLRARQNGLLAQLKRALSHYERGRALGSPAECTWLHNAVFHSGVLVCNQEFVCPWGTRGSSQCVAFKGWGRFILEHELPWRPDHCTGHA